MGYEGNCWTNSQYVLETIINILLASTCFGNFQKTWLGIWSIHHVYVGMKKEINRLKTLSKGFVHFNILQINYSWTISESCYKYFYLKQMHTNSICNINLICLEWFKFYHCSVQPYLLISSNCQNHRFSFLLDAILWPCRLDCYHFYNKSNTLPPVSIIHH